MGVVWFIKLISIFMGSVSRCGFVFCVEVLVIGCS